MVIPFLLSILKSNGFKVSRVKHGTYFDMDFISDIILVLCEYNNKIARTYIDDRTDINVPISAHHEIVNMYQSGRIYGKISYNYAIG